jgi:hypothetical protein
VGERGLALGQSVVGQDLADSGFCLVRDRLIAVLTSGRLVLGLPVGRLVAVLSAG